MRPRPAASRVLIRRDQGMLELLLGRRPATMVFMAGAYVFAGGLVEREDRRIPLATVTRAVLSEALLSGAGIDPGRHAVFGYHRLHGPRLRYCRGRG